MRFLNELALFIQRTGEQLSSAAADIATAEAKRLVPDAQDAYSVASENLTLKKANTGLGAACLTLAS